jgi:hypothetical protein
MRFKLGKHYKHATGKCMSIVGEATTIIHGKCLVGESNGDGGLVPVGTGSDHAANWVEISTSEWMCAITPDDAPYVAPTITASEALYAFCAWLTGRKNSVVLGASHDCSPIPKLIDSFIESQRLGSVRDNYNDYLEEYPSL